MDVQKFFNDLGMSHFCKEPEVLVAKQEHKNKVYEDCLSILRDEYPVRPSGNDKIIEGNFIRQHGDNKVFGKDNSELRRLLNLNKTGKNAKGIKFL